MQTVDDAYILRRTPHLFHLLLDVQNLGALPQIKSQMLDAVMAFDEASSGLFLLRYYSMDLP